MKYADVYNEPNYEVSELGIVRRKPHVVPDKRYGERNLPERFLKLIKDKDGYYLVRLSHRLAFVHVLVLEAFVGPRPEGMQCCHNNGIADDNKLKNLRWDTPRNNVRDRKLHGTYQYDQRNPNYKHGNSFYCKKNRESALGGSRASQRSGY